MLILKKKQFLMITFLLFISFSSVFLAKNNNIENRTYDVTQVSSVPVTQKVIVVDAGHRSEKTGGAVSKNRK